MTDCLTLRDKNPLCDKTDWQNYFEDTANLGYRIMTQKHQTFIITDKNEYRDVNEIPHFWIMKRPTVIENMKDTDSLMINGHEVKPNSRKALWKYGLPLEATIQLALRKARIDFNGNSLNEAHYMHNIAKERHTDLETEYLLIEATNIEKWLNFDKFQEKINYFFKTDPKHLKKWVIVTTYQKAIPKLIRQQILNYDITVLYTNEVANSHNINQLANQLYKPLLQLTQLATNNKFNELILLTVKNQYLDYSVNSNSPEVDPCRSNIYENSSGLAG